MREPLDAQNRYVCTESVDRDAAADCVYRGLRRIHAFFTNPQKGEASPALVGEMIRYVIESDDRRLRFPVGPDALPFLGWRSAVSDADWVGLGGLKDDADYFQRVFTDTGVDLRKL